MGFLSGLFGSGGAISPSYSSFGQVGQEDLQNYLTQFLQQGIQNPPQLQLPPEYQQAAGVYGNIANLPIDTFQYPLEDIRKYLDAYQAQGYQDYLKDIRPYLASTGSLDSTYGANLVSDYLQRMATGRLGTEADILTQQAIQDAQNRQALYGLRLQGAGGLENIGGARTGIEQFNTTFPYQYQIPSGQNQLGLLYGQQQNQYQTAMQEFQRQQQQKARMGGSIGSLIGAGGALALAPFTGGASLAFLPAASQIGGSIGSGQPTDLSRYDFSSLLSSQYPSISKSSPLGGNLKRLGRQNQLYPGAIQQSRQYASYYPGFFN